MCIKVAIGQDSHRFADQPAAYRKEGAIDISIGDDAAVRQPFRPLLLGGVEFSGAPPLLGNSDADVVLHALCNAISGVTGVNILGEVSDRMCLKEGITDSAAYVREAMKHLAGGRIEHVSFSIECSRPIVSPSIMEMRRNIAAIIGTDISCVCITATSGERLTDFGRGLGIQVLCILTAVFC